MHLAYLDPGDAKPSGRAFATTARMLRSLLDLDPFDRDGALRVVVESPRGSQVKFDLDPETGTFIYGRPLPLGLAYPNDWGFIPGTRASDGDPVDAMVIAEATSFPGVIIPCRLMGVVQLEEQEDGETRRNDRVIAAPVRCSASDSKLEDEPVPERLRAELEQFFVNVVLFEKKVKILGWADPKSARELIRRARTGSDR